MKPKKRRARRGDVGLVQLRSGYWAIRWGRALSRETGLPKMESTGMLVRADAERVMRERQLQVAGQRGDTGVRAALLRTAPIVALDALVSDFLRAYSAGDLRGARPSPATIDNTICLLLGTRGGLVPFAVGAGRATTERFDAVLVQRWLESERTRVAGDTLRLKRLAALKLAEFAVERAFIAEDRLTAMRALPVPRSARGRARADGVPSLAQVHALLDAMTPSYWRDVAELQLRLGVRRGEVLAIDADWIDEARAVVCVRPGNGFDTKNHLAREIDGVDPATLALAKAVVALKGERGLSRSGYVEAWKRALRRLERAGVSWPFRSKTHALRALYATASREAGVPLSIVRDRMGHESERTTEKHYVGRMVGVAPGPFSNVPRRSGDGEGGAKVIPFRRPA
jgi:integrase